MVFPEAMFVQIKGIDRTSAETKGEILITLTLPSKIQKNRLYSTNHKSLEQLLQNESEFSWFMEFKSSRLQVDMPIYTLEGGVHSFLEKQLQRLGLSKEELPTDGEGWRKFVDSLDQAFVANEAKFEELRKTLQVTSEQANKAIVSRKKKEKEIASLLNKLASNFKTLNENINYALQIQTSGFPSPQLLSTIFKDWCCYWQPKEIVGGDFYWVHRHADDSVMVAVADCVGHGVSGAFLALTARATLDRIVRSQEMARPNEVMNALHSELRSIFNANSADKSANAIDVAVLRIEPSSKRVTYAGAHQPLFLLESGSVSEIKGDKHSIGVRPESFEYSNYNLTVSADSTFYLVTDGFYEQKGGRKNIPLGKGRLKQLFEQVGLGHQLADQKRILIDYFNEYKGRMGQMDDCTLLGFKVSD